MMVKYKENIFMEQKMFVAKVISDVRDPWKLSLSQRLNETVLYSRRTLHFNFLILSYLALFIIAMKSRF